MKCKADTSDSYYPTFFVLGACIALGVLLRIQFFYTSYSFLPVTTDEALSVLIAHGIYEGARPLLFWGTPYQFPFESYLLAFFSPFLSNGALSARLLPALLAFFAVLNAFILAAYTLKKTSRWLAWCFVIVPATYLFTLQTAYFIPQYTMSFVYAMTLPLLAVIYLRRQGAAILFLLALLMGFSLANHLLSLPPFAGIWLCLLVQTNIVTICKRILILALGNAIGLLPYILTYGTARGSAKAVTATIPLSEGLERFFSLLLQRPLGTVLGFSNTPFPDLGYEAAIIPGLDVFGLLFFWVALLTVTVCRTREVVVRLLRREQHVCEGIDIFVATTWASLFSFVLSNRASSDEYRYLLPVAWCFPFVVAYCYETLNGAWKQVILIPSMVLLLLNCTHTSILIARWQQPEYLRETQDLPRLGIVRKYLRKQNIHHCYASFWHVNRLTFESKKKLLCTQAYNERFVGWPLHYKEQIDSVDRVAYVLSNSKYARFTADQFEAVLRVYHINAQAVRLGAFRVYHDFTEQDGTSARTRLRKLLDTRY